MYGPCLLRGRSQFISFKNSYHGSTHGSLSIQGSDKYKGGYYPLLPDTLQANFNDFAVLEQITSKTAGVVIECIQAGSGYIPADPAWIKAVRARCREVGALMILDEIQTGMGRTGPWFAHLDYGFCPDIMCLAKAYGGGLPLGAFVAPEHIMKVIQADPILGHITTFGLKSQPRSSKFEMYSFILVLRRSVARDSCTVCGSSLK